MKNQTRKGLRSQIIGTTIAASALILTVAVCIFSCTKHNTAESTAPVDANNVKLKVQTAQPLPGGRAYYTAALGHFQTSTGQACWTRVVNYTFNAAAGSVSAELWEWKSTDQFGKTLVTTHTCSVDGPSKTCSQYSPTGWIVGTSTNPSFNWSGTYTYNSTTGALHISWPAVGSGASEDWTVSNVSGKALSTWAFVGSSSNYGITDGYAFGSSKAFTGTAGVNYKTVNNVPRVDMFGHLRGCGWTGTGPYTLSGQPQDPPFSNMGGVTGGNAIHMLLPTSDAGCTSGCSTSRTGIIYHLTSLNNSRMMAYNHHCACLPTNALYPCYNNSLHPYAMMQIIDDNGAMQGLVGIHEQDEPGSVGFGYSINYWMYP
jgi:hypothetical protein